MNELQILEDMAHYQHSLMVARISAILAAHAGYSEQEAKLVEQAAHYHDIGKNYIPANILHKPGKLTDKEFERIKTHTTLGHRQIKSTTKILRAADTIAYCHHEKWDGKGYHGIRGEDIPEYARLVAIADVFDALVSKRCYKEAWSLEDATDYIANQAEAEFDPKFVEAFMVAADKIAALYKD